MKKLLVVGGLLAGASDAPAQVFFGPPPDPFGPPVAVRVRGGGFVVTSASLWDYRPPRPPAAVWASPYYDPWAIPPAWLAPPRVVVVVPPPVVVVQPPAVIPDGPPPRIDLIVDNPVAEGVRRGDLIPVLPKKAGEALPVPKAVP